MNMRLNADLAVLSACETGNGKISVGEGVIGMSWAFFVSGNSIASGKPVASKFRKYVSS
jgi:CHAT domain-containing protein